MVEMPIHTPAPPIYSLYNEAIIIETNAERGLKKRPAFTNSTDLVSNTNPGESSQVVTINRMETPPSTTPINRWFHQFLKEEDLAQVMSYSTITDSNIAIFWNRPVMKDKIIGC
jgi:hypothetical protein